MNLKKTLTLFRHVFDVISFPSLVLHEFWHAVATLCVGGKIKSIHSHSIKKARIRILNLDTPFKVRIVAKSPLMSLIIALSSPGIISYNMLFFSFYILLTFHVSIPSYLDFHMAEMKPPCFYKLIFNKTHLESIHNIEP